jgi:hypothetical protein
LFHFINIYYGINNALRGLYHGCIREMYDVENPEFADHDAAQKEIDYSAVLW